MLGIARDITEHKRVEKELKDSRRRLRALSSKLLSTQEEERRRIAVELHDSIGSSLSAIMIHADNVLRNTKSGDAAHQSIERILSVAKGAVEETRRIITDLRPSILDDFGIVKTAQWFCGEFRVSSPGAHTETRIDLCEDDVPEPLKIAIFRILQEGFHNIARYSKADRVVLSLAKKDTVIELMIEDNGVGFDVHAAFRGKRDKGGIGLSSMRERAELTGGSFFIESAKEKGTTLCARWPCQ